MSGNRKGIAVRDIQTEKNNHGGCYQKYVPPDEVLSIGL